MLLELNCRAEQRAHIGPPELRYPARASSALHVKSQTVYVQGYHGTALQRSTTVCPITRLGLGRIQAPDVHVTYDQTESEDKCSQLHVNMSKLYGTGGIMSAVSHTCTLVPHVGISSLSACISVFSAEVHALIPGLPCFIFMQLYSCRPADELAGLLLDTEQLSQFVCFMCDWLL